MSPLPGAFGGRSPQPAMEAGVAGKPGEAAFVKVMLRPPGNNNNNNNNKEFYL